MKDVIKTLAEAFSVNELTAMIRKMSDDPNISDDTVRMYASALCICWMGYDDGLYKILEELTSENSQG